MVFFNPDYSLRTLEPWEKLEIPLIVSEAELNDDDPSHVFVESSSILPPSDYEIQVVGGNVQVKKRGDGTYSVVLTGHNNPGGETIITCGTQELPKTYAGFCLRYVNKRGDRGLQDPYNVLIQMDTSDNSYGETRNITYTSLTSGRGFWKPVEPNDADPSDGKTLKLVAVDPTTVEEPPHNPNEVDGSRYQNKTDHGFDIIIEPGPSGAVSFDFCLDTNHSTASYYEDVRIVSENDHLNDYPVGGWAFDTTTGCTKGGPWTNKRKTRHYVRVFGDSLDEGTEIFKFRVRINSPNNENISPTHSNWLTYTITNDGPLPKAWLSRFGHSVADQVMDLVSQRVKAKRTPGGTLKLGSASIPLGKVTGSSLADSVGSSSSSSFLRKQESQGSSSSSSFLRKQESQGSYGTDSRLRGNDGLVGNNEAVSVQGSSSSSSAQGSSSSSSVQGSSSSSSFLRKQESQGSYGTDSRLRGNDGLVDNNGLVGNNEAVSVQGSSSSSSLQGSSSSSSFLRKQESPTAKASASSAGSSQANAGAFNRNSFFQEEEEAQVQEITWAQIQENSSFNLTTEDSSGGFLSLYGQLSFSSFNSDIDGLNVESSNRHALLGMDYARDKWLWGLGFGAHSGDGSAGGSVGQYDIDSDLSTWFGYGARTVGEGNTLWGTVGYGEGEIGMTRERAEVLEERRAQSSSEGSRLDLGKADTSWDLFGVGFDSVLRETERYRLSLVGDAFWTGIDSEKASGYDSSSSSSRRQRIGLESRIGYGGFSISPSSFLRRDSGDVDNESNLELGLSSDWRVSDKLFLSGRGRYVVDNEDRFRSYSLGMEYSPGGRNAGSSVYSFDVLGDEGYQLGWKKPLKNGAELNLSAEPEKESGQLNYIITF